MGWFDKKQKRKFNFRNPKIYTTTSKEVNVKFNYIYIWIFLIIVLISIMIWWLFYSDYFKIKNIIIEGSINQDIQKEIDTFYRQNILKFTIGQMDKELAKKQSSIDYLEIIKGIPDTLKIDVKVRDPLIKWSTNKKEYFIDKNGIIFDLKDDLEQYKELPKVIDSRNLEIKQGSKIVAQEFVQFICDVVDKTKSEIDKEIQEISVDETTLYINVKFKEKYRIYFDTTTNLNKQIHILKNIIDNHLSEVKEYIDLRIDGKAYYK